jgi:hypothetical protein
MPGLNEFLVAVALPQAHHIFATRGKDIGDMHFSSERLRAWVVSLIERAAERKEPIESRISPRFQSYLLEPSSVAQQIEILKSAGHVAITVKTLPHTGRCRDVGLEKPVVIALCVGDTVYAINLEEVSVRVLDGLKECKLVAYDALNQMSILKIMGLDIGVMECVGLADSIYLKKMSRRFSNWPVSGLGTIY